MTGLANPFVSQDQVNEKIKSKMKLCYRQN